MQRRDSWVAYAQHGLSSSTFYRQSEFWRAAYFLHASASRQSLGELVEQLKAWQCCKPFACPTKSTPFGMPSVLGSYTGGSNEVLTLLNNSQASNLCALVIAGKSMEVATVCGIACTSPIVPST